MIKIKNLVKIGAVTLLIGGISLSTMAASNYKTPAEAVAGLTGRTVESILSERAETGKTLGTIASDAGKLEEFKKENLEIKKDVLQSRVDDGTMTQEKADETMKAIEENQVNCDGTGNGCGVGGQGMGAGCGTFGGNGAGCGLGQGMGAGCGLNNGTVTN